VHLSARAAGISGVITCPNCKVNISLVGGAPSLARMGVLHRTRDKTPALTKSGCKYCNKNRDASKP